MRSNYTYSKNYGRRPAPKSPGFLHTLLIYILPFLVFNGIIFYFVTSRPNIDIEMQDTKDYVTAQVSIKITSLLPTRSLKASMDDKEIELTKESGKHYTATINRNGALEVYLENFNGMSTTVFEHINILDDNPPAIINQQTENDILTIQLEDSQSGINYSAIYATTSDGTTVQPLSVDKTAATVTFEMDPNGLNVFACDLSGNEVQAHVTSSIENMSETQDTESESSSDSNLKESAAKAKETKN